MSDSIFIFFEAWAINSDIARLEKISSAVTETIRYDDPRTTETVQGIEALSTYVGMFSVNAPGWSAKVINTDITGRVTRATVAFSGIGPDGTEKVQIGQYFVEKEDDLLSRMVGFAGTGQQQ